MTQHVKIGNRVSCLHTQSCCEDVTQKQVTSTNWLASSKCQLPTEGMRGPHWQNRDGGVWEGTKLCVGVCQKVWHSCVATGTASKGIQRLEAWTVQTALTSVLRHMMGELGTQDKNKEKQMVLSSPWASEQWPVKNFGKWGKWSGFWSKDHDIKLLPMHSNSWVLARQVMTTKDHCSQQSLLS